MASSTSSLILHTSSTPSIFLPRCPPTVKRRSVGGARATASGSAGNARPSSSSSSTSNWLSTIFGWPSEPDYIDGGDPKSEENQPPPRSAGGGEENELASRRSGSSRFTPGCFTEEKAKQLRMKTMETSAFHDVMYHSAIAARLASSFPDPPRGKGSRRSPPLDP
ncbi:uncharacterized protein LOC116256305 [Nymphaea colorata]|uniref:uncharacterized protein LOC116256305 n=1 Tax=Nymphaea colorata TaxID=210225 RepID=UPI00129EAC23|nr:uncharacterized protein LOC116256305 [Nymphaea colorata]